MVQLAGVRRSADHPAESGKEPRVYRGRRGEIASRRHGFRNWISTKRVNAVRRPRAGLRRSPKKIEGIYHERKTFIADSP